MRQSASTRPIVLICILTFMILACQSATPAAPTDSPAATEVSGQSPTTAPTQSSAPTTAPDNTAISPTLQNTVDPLTVALCKLQDSSGDGGVGLGFPPISSRMPSTGDVVAEVLFVDFPDVTSSQ